MNALPSGQAPPEKPQSADVWHRFWNGFGRLERIVLVGSVAVTCFCAGLNVHRQRELPPLFHEAPGVSSSAKPALRVQVVGSVKRAGVFSLPVGARVEDALRIAGGATSGADARALNLAAHLKDGERVVVPMRGAAVVASNGAPSSAAISSAPIVKASTAKTQAPRIVNINTASALELEALPGVGPALAARIVAYRTQKGRIGSLDELDQVKGFGPKKLEKLRPYAAF